MNQPSGYKQAALSLHLPYTNSNLPYKGVAGTANKAAFRKAFWTLENAVQTLSIIITIKMALLLLNLWKLFYTRIC